MELKFDRKIKNTKNNISTEILEMDNMDKIDKIWTNGQNEMNNLVEIHSNSPHVKKKQWGN